MLTYAALAERLKMISPKASWGAHQLPRSRSNDGTALVAVDLAEIEPKPKPPLRPVRPLPAFALKACIDSRCKRSDLLHVPYRGQPQVLTDLLGGQAAGHL